MPSFVRAAPTSTTGDLEPRSFSGVLGICCGSMSLLTESAAPIGSGVTQAQVSGFAHSQPGAQQSR